MLLEVSKVITFGDKLLENVSAQFVKTHQTVHSTCAIVCVLYFNKSPHTHTHTQKHISEKLLKNPKTKP